MATIRKHVRIFTFNNYFFPTFVLITYLIMINFKLINSFLFMLVFLFKYNNFISMISDGKNPISLIISKKVNLYLATIILISSIIIYIK